MKKQILVFCILFGCVAYTAMAQLNYQWVKGVNSGSPSSRNLSNAIAVDNQGNTYVTGTLTQSFDSVNFNPYGTAPVNIANDKGGNCFFAKYDSAGNCKWAKRLDLFGLDSDPFVPVATGAGIAVDPSGNVYITGAFRDSIDLNPAPGSGPAVYKMKSEGLSDCFVAKYNSSGAFVWARQFGGDGLDFGTSVSVTGTEVYITGFFSDSTAYFKSSLSGTADDTLYNSGWKDVFIAKYSSNGTLQWTKGIGGIGDDLGVSIDVNSAYVALTGSFQDTVDFNPESAAHYDTVEASGNTDVFLAKYLPDGSYGWELNIGKNNGNTNSAVGTSVKIDNNYNKIYVAGNFSGAADFDLAYNPNSSKEDALCDRAAFLAKYDLAAGAFEWRQIFRSQEHNGTDTTTSPAIVLDHSGDFVFVTGGFTGKMGMNQAGTDSVESKGEVDMYIAKYDKNSAYIWSKGIGKTHKDVGCGIAIDNSENIYVTGTFMDTVNFDPGVGVAKRGAQANSNALFVAKYGEGTSIITGNVFYNGTVPVTVGFNYVRLYTQTPNDGNEAMHMVDQTSIDMNGVYTFTNVENGDYLVLAFANNTDYANAAPTYFGDTTNWLGANHIVVQSNPYYYADIHLKTTTFNFNGTATLSGTVLEGDGYDRVAGEPISGVGVGLEGVPGGIVGHTETDNNGNYQFTHVPAGCYKIYVYIPGLPMDSTYHECPSALDTIVHLDFIADSGSISINPLSTNIITTVAKKGEIQIYPNPYRESLYVKYILESPDNVSIEIYNLLGERMLSIQDEQRTSGEYLKKLNVLDSGLKAGSYFINIKANNVNQRRKIIQIE
jgi:hypothetical protein